MNSKSKRMNLLLLELTDRLWKAGTRLACVIATWSATPSKIVHKSGLLLLILMQCCGTIASHSDFSTGATVLPPGVSRFYRGVQYDGKHLDGAFGLVVMGDVPVSFLADTLMLPFDARSHYTGAQPRCSGAR